MISKMTGEGQMERLRGLSFFPRDNAAAVTDLMNALKASATDAIAIAVVNEWITTSSEAPKPADLRRMVWAENEKHDSRSGRHKRCPLCGGDGWITVWMLATFSGNSHIVRRREIIPGIRNQEAADEFCAKLPEGQSVLTGAVPCECLPDSHHAFTEQGAKRFPKTYEEIRKALGI